MKQEEMESLQEFLEGKIDIGQIPAGITIQGIMDWALGYMACTVKVMKWAAEQEAKETTRFQEILESVEAEFMNGEKERKSIEGDSGIAIIRDVLKMFG